MSEEREYIKRVCRKCGVYFQVDLRGFLCAGLTEKEAFLRCPNGHVSVASETVDRRRYARDKLEQRKKKKATESLDKS